LTNEHNKKLVKSWRVRLVSGRGPFLSSSLRKGEGSLYWRR